MTEEQRERATNLQELIAKEEKLIELTQHEAWIELIKGLSDMRVGAFYRAISEGDTTDAKAYARAVDNIISYLRSIGNPLVYNDLIEKLDSLKDDIRLAESEANRYVSQGMGATI